MVVGYLLAVRPLAQGEGSRQINRGHKRHSHGARSTDWGGLFDDAGQTVGAGRSTG